MRRCSKADTLEGLINFFADLKTFAPLDFEREGNIFVDGPPGQQLEILEDDTKIATQVRNLRRAKTRDVAPIHQNLAAARALCTVKQLEQGRLACSRRPGQVNELTLFNLEGDIVQSVLVTLVSLADIKKLDHVSTSAGKGQIKSENACAG